MDTDPNEVIDRYSYVYRDIPAVQHQDDSPDLYLTYQIAQTLNVVSFVNKALGLDMAFGILESDPSLGTPPGTELLEEVQIGSHDASQVLIPHPSNSFHDPLNMSRVRKEFYFFALIWGACMTGVIGPLLVPGFSIVAASFNIVLTQVTLLNGSLIMALGVSAYLCAPLSIIYGRRIVYLITTLIMIFGCVWASYATSYGSLLGSRIFQGLGMGAFFSLAGTASINDVFFVHERGRRAGLWNFAVIVSVNIAPVISGYVITGLGWQWSFRLLAIGFAVTFILAFFLIPETRYDRDVMLRGIDISTQDATILKHETKPNIEETHDPLHAASPAPKSGRSESVETAPASSKFNWRNLLSLQNITFEHPSLLLPMLMSPLALLGHPAVLWGSAMWSVTFSWVIIQGAVADQIFRAPPYNQSPTAVGILIGVPPLIGSAMGTILGGWLCDMVARSMSIKNSGVYEPEFRLWVLIPSLITTGIGSYGLGISVSLGQTIWAAAVFLGFLNFGVGMACTAIIAYTNDVCQKKAAEAFGVAMVSCPLLSLNTFC